MHITVNKKQITNLELEDKNIEIVKDAMEKYLHDGFIHLYGNVHGIDKDVKKYYVHLYKEEVIH